MLACLFFSLANKDLTVQSHGTVLFLFSAQAEQREWRRRAWGFGRVSSRDWSGTPHRWPFLCGPYCLHVLCQHDVSVICILVIIISFLVFSDSTRQMKSSTERMVIAATTRTWACYIDDGAWIYAMFGWSVNLLLLVVVIYCTVGRLFLFFIFESKDCSSLT